MKQFFLLILLAMSASVTFAQTATAEEAGGMSTGLIIFICAILLILFVGFIWYANIALWFKAKASGVSIGTHELAVMRYKGVPPAFILNFMIRAKEAGLDLPHQELVGLYLSKEKTGDKGAVEKVVNIMITTHNAELDVDIDDIIRYYHAKVDIQSIVDVMVLAKNSRVPVLMSDLVNFQLSHVDVKKMIETYIKAHSSNIKSISIDELRELHHSGIDIEKLVIAMVKAKEGGLFPPLKAYTTDAEKREQETAIEKEFLQKLIAHHQSGGNILGVVHAVIAGKSADRELDNPDVYLKLTFDAAANIDLAGINVEDAVKDAVNFRVITTDAITAFAADGVQLTLRCQVTIRPIIRKIIKGAGQETVLARINEGIVSQIGLTRSHKEILEDPHKLADQVEKRKDIFADTAYEVISIDISNIEVGKDIEAELKTQRAKANLAEEQVRRLVIESEVQKAMADAFRDGNFSIQDYHKMKNLEADTDMRGKIGNKSGEATISI